MQNHCTIIRYYVTPHGLRHWQVQAVYRCNIDQTEFTRPSTDYIYNTKKEAKTIAIRLNSELDQEA
jgi:hypothetical protein